MIAHVVRALRPRHGVEICVGAGAGQGAAEPLDSDPLRVTLSPIDRRLPFKIAHSDMVLGTRLDREYRRQGEDRTQNFCAGHIAGHAIGQAQEQAGEQISKLQGPGGSPPPPIRT